MSLFGQAMKKSLIGVLDQYFVDMCQTEDGLQAAIDLVSRTGICSSKENIEFCINSADDRFSSQVIKNNPRIRFPPVFGQHL